MSVEDRPVGPIFILQSIHNEDTEVVSNTEYECRKYNIDDIELYSYYSHHSNDYNPTDEHWKEAD